MCLRNVGLSPCYTTLQPRRPQIRCGCSPCRISVRTGTRPDLALDAKANFWSTSLCMRSVALALGRKQANRDKSRKLRSKDEEQGTAQQNEPRELGRCSDWLRAGPAEEAGIDPPAGDFSLHHSVQIWLWGPPASYPVGTDGPFPWRCRGVKLTDGAMPPLPITSSWRSALLVRHRGTCHYSLT
jgi:hypothetical protein